MNYDYNYYEEHLILYEAVEALCIDDNNNLFIRITNKDGYYEYQPATEDEAEDWKIRHGFLKKDFLFK